MNDEELERRLHDELHRRIEAPSVAPYALRRQVEEAWDLEPVASARAPRRFRLTALAGLGAVAAVAALILGGLFLRPRSLPAGTSQLPASIEMFQRIDARTAWAASGGDLYITRDAGVTWSKGTLPGKGMAAAYGTARPAPAGCNPEDASFNPNDCTTTTSSGFPDRLYPQFIDAEHGWLVSWTLSNPAEYTNSDFSLTINRTSDGGRSWTAIAVPGLYRGFGVVQFVDANHGLLAVYSIGSAASSSATSAPGSGQPPAEGASGTTLLGTNDGGTTWTKRSTLSGISFLKAVSASEAWAFEGVPTGNHAQLALHHSVDGGASWTEGLLPASVQCSGMPSDLEPVKKGDTLEISLACAQANYGGTTATAAPASPVPTIGPPPSPGPSGAATPAASPADWAGSGMTATIVRLQSRDNGETWTETTRGQVEGTPLVNSLATAFAIGPVLSQPMVVAGDYMASPQTLRASFDNGGSWRMYTLTALPGYVYQTDWASPDDVWIGLRVEGASGVPAMTLYASTDGGKTWRALAGPVWPASQAPVPTPVLPILTPPVPQPTANGPEPTPYPTSPAEVVPYREIGAIDGVTAYAVRAGVIWISQDSGASWSQSVMPAADGAFDVYDANHLAMLDYVPAYGMPRTTAGLSFVVASSADGGRSFDTNTVSAGVPGGAIVQDVSVHYLTASHAVIWIDVQVSDKTYNVSRICFRADTNDAGKSWSAAATATCPITRPEMPITWATPLVGWQYVDNLDAGKQIVLTTDGGTTWRTGTIPSQASGVGEKSLIAGLAAENGRLTALLFSYATAASTVYQLVSTDGGGTWQLEWALVTHVVPIFAAAGPGHWFLGADTVGSLYETEDSGATWIKVQAAGLTGSLTAIDFANGSVGWASTSDSGCDAAGACVDGPALFTTSDGGRTWRLVEPHTAT